MKMFVARTCTEIPGENADRHGRKESRPLEAFRDAAAYVLLGDPGAGKTTAFETECRVLGEKACLVSTRDFLTFDPQDHPEWRGKTLFIDGLDETRAGADDARTPFDQIRKRLDMLGKPSFRLSCRAADWLGENDRKHLESVSPDSGVAVLRLDPLTDEDVASILDARGDILDAEAFIAAARERRVDGLLANPQTLGMLADVVGRGEGWPENRKETFEMACGQMVHEHNEEHQAARESGSPTPPDQLLDAAGRLCALQLISGVAGYTLRGEPDEEYPALDQCSYHRPEALRFALATKLFKATSNNRFSPVHRHIAEFLGGKHLARVIQDRLPARRVVSMMAGEDGVVVTEMRGLSAWLAAHSRDARSDLIERDPIGVGLYGDIGGFSLDEKRVLLGALQHEGIRLGSLWNSAAAFGALATLEMEPVLREILKNRNRSPDHQMSTEFVLRVLEEGSALPSLTGTLLEIVRDDTRWPRVNSSALNAFSHNCPNTPDKVGELKSLLADIRGKRISDPDKELFGAVLIQLYPQELPPAEIWEYLSEQGHPELYGRYRRFWDTRLIEQSSEEQMAELLDSLHRRLPGLRVALDARHLSALPLKLLALGLEIHGNHLKPERQYDWLSVGLLWDEDPQTSRFGAEPIRRIRDWLEQHPESRKAVYAEGLGRSLASDEFQSFSFNVRKRLYGASPPPDFGLWFLERAVSLAGERPHVAEHLLGWAVDAHREHSGQAGLSLEVLRERTQEKATLRERLDQLLSPSPLEKQLEEDGHRWRQDGEEQQRRWLEHVRSNKTELLENRAAPSLLYRMAELFFLGPKAIEEDLGGDPGLIDATLQGLRNSIHRRDVPTLEEILRLRAQDKVHYLGEPYLAGIAEAEKTTAVSQWDDDRVRKAIAFYYCSELSDQKPEPDWYRRLLVQRPGIIAEVQVQFAVSEFRRGREYIDKLWELSCESEYAGVVRQASLPLLRAFPTRCKLKQMQALDSLLKAAIQHADRPSFQELIDTKLSRKSMNEAQRVYWLAAGVIVAPGVYRDQLRDFAQSREDRTRHLMAFFENSRPDRFSCDELGHPTLELLILLGASSVGPDQQWADKAGFVTPAMEASRLVGDLIQRLAASPAKEASTALADLLADPALSRWHEVLSRAQDTQQVIRRDASYRHPDIAQVCRTLNGGTPANAGDLAALVMDRLCELAEQIRRGNTDDWRQYWNEPHGQSPTPKHEDHCRDALLSALRQRLPQEVDAQPEGQYANDTRADIRVSCRDFQVPVEIKKNKHPDLWSAPRNQLVAKYTSDPATGGYGIYLVFWFGKDLTPPPPSGVRPANAEELKKRMEETLSPNEARKISVCVIDVSRPD